MLMENMAKRNPLEAKKEKYNEPATFAGGKR